MVDTRVEPQQRVEREQQFVEADLREREDRAGLLVERTSTLLTAIPLKLPMAAVVDHRLSEAVGAIRSSRQRTCFNSLAAIAFD